MSKPSNNPPLCYLEKSFEKIIDDIIRDHPSYYCVKSDTKLTDLLAKIKELLT